MTPRTATPPPRPSLVARFGPLAVILIALGAIAFISSTKAGTEPETVSATATATSLADLTTRI